jgi:hypothetical protein
VFTVSAFSVKQGAIFDLCTHEGIIRCRSSVVRDAAMRVK